MAEVRAQSDERYPYSAARSEAQRAANESGLDHGVYHNEFGGYYAVVLPNREHRRGPELKCEVVSPEVLARCAPGHGPLPAVGSLITEGMGTYRVLAHLGGTRLRVESHVGTRIEIDYADSGYRDPRNAWRPS